MGQILVTALIAGAVVGLANSIFASDGTLFTAVEGVITKIVNALDGVSLMIYPIVNTSFMDTLPKLLAA